MVVILYKHYDSSDAFLVFGDNGQYDAGRIVIIIIYITWIFVLVGNNPRMTIDDNGVVAIGHTSPWSTVKLDLGLLEIICE